MVGRVVRSIERILKQLKDRSINQSLKQSTSQSIKRSSRDASHPNRPHRQHQRTRVAHRKQSIKQQNHAPIDINKEPWFEDGTGDEILINAFQPSIDYFYLPEVDQSIDHSSQSDDEIVKHSTNQTANRPINHSNKQAVTQSLDDTTDQYGEDHHHLRILIEKSRRSFEEEFDEDDEDVDRMHMLFGLAMLPLYSVGEDDECEEEPNQSSNQPFNQSGYQSTNVSSASTSPSLSPQTSPYMHSLNSSYSPSSRSTTSSLSPSFSPQSFTRSPAHSSSRCDSTSSDSDNEPSERTKRIRSRFVRSQSFSQSPRGAHHDQEIAERATHAMLSNALTLDGELELTSEMMNDLDSWRYLGSFLMKTPRACSLKARGIMIGLPQVRALGQGALKYLRHLELSDNHLNDEIVLHIVKLLLTASLIQTLRVERNNVKSVAPFTDLITNHQQLVHLSLAFNAVDGSGASELAKALRSCARSDRASLLQIVDLQRNQIDSAGVAALKEVEALMHHTSPELPFYIDTGGQRPELNRPLKKPDISPLLRNPFTDLSYRVLPLTVRTHLTNVFPSTFFASSFAAASLRRS